MKLLALDTAANLCSVAILDLDTGMLLASISNDIGKGHAERLMGLVEKALMQADCDLAAIGKIAVSIGPGSFTGVRVGVSTARGFALALKCPAVGISTLEALAWDAARTLAHRPVLAVIDARREEFYVQFFAADGTAATTPTITPLDNILNLLGEYPADLVLAGSGAASVNARLERPLDVAVTAATGTVAAFAALGASREPGGSPKPLYLRGLDVKPQQGFVLKRKPSP